MCLVFLVTTALLTFIRQVEMETLVEAQARSQNQCSAGVSRHAMRRSACRRNACACPPRRNRVASRSRALKLHRNKELAHRHVLCDLITRNLRIIEAFAPGGFGFNNGKNGKAWEDAMTTRRSLLRGRPCLAVDRCGRHAHDGSRRSRPEEGQGCHPAEQCFHFELSGRQGRRSFQQAGDRPRCRPAALCRIPRRPAQQAMHGGDLLGHGRHPEDKRGPGLGDYRRRPHGGAECHRPQGLALQVARRSAREEIRYFFHWRRLVQGGKGGHDRRLSISTS